MPTFLTPYVERVGGPRRAMIALVGVATALLIFGLSRWATAPTWVPAFSGLPLEQVGALTEKLEQASIQYRLEQGGSQVMVPASELARARVLLAQDGMPGAGRPGLELFDQPSWGMTDFTQRVNYRRALEGELERTIGKMRGVEAAQVHLALRETQSFRRADARPAQASVVIKLRNGQPAAADVVQGIAHLVASSVDGIEAEGVTVLDDAGRLLSTPHQPNSLAGLTSRQLAMQQEVEGYLERKAEELVAQLVGPGNASVQVSAAVNFDRVDRTTQSVDPDRQAIATEQRAEITPGAEGGAGSTNTAMSYENSHTVETVSGSVGNVKRLTVAVLVNDRLVPSPDSTLPPTVVARTPEELQRIETLVRSAVGFDSARGDVVSVVAMPFAPTLDLARPEPAPTMWERVDEVQKPALGALGLLLAAVVALVAIRSLRVPALPAGVGAPTLAAAGAAGALPEGATAAAALAEPARPAVLEPRPPSPAQLMREQVVAGVEQNPDVAVRLVRSWMKDG
ncbi:MAG TPA: flagellar basal-body MS-ring/collar protein FliF [Gemmatimonadaceae bacterium]|nr:flagellar basal-body MS-ring/collar protein FliF [Gemmatimonadaceae bacterium]